MPTAGLPLPTNLKGGQYRVDRILSVGGLSIIYQGLDANLNRAVAIKELFPQGSARNDATVIPSAAYDANEWAQARREYLNEARTVAGFDHPGVVDVSDYFEENNTAYMVMKFINGETLEQYTVRHGGRLPEAEAKEYVRQIGEALQQLHNQEPPIYHRDIKPRNIMVTGQNRAVLIDFGGTREVMTEMAGRQEVLFTPGYTAPEQLSPSAFTNRRPTADVFALAATLYYLLTGSDPYSANFVAPKYVNEATRKALMHALNQDAAKRPQTVRAFLNELYELSGLPGMVATTPGWLRWVGGIVGAILLGVLTNWLSGGGIVEAFRGVFNGNNPTPTVVALIDTPTPVVTLAPHPSETLIPTATEAGGDTVPTATPRALVITTATPQPCDAAALNVKPPANSAFQPNTDIAERSTIRAGGSTFVAPLLQRWTVDYAAKYKVNITYSCTGSGGGIADLQNGDVNFAAADYYQQGLKGVNGNILQVPVTIGGVAIVTNFPNTSISQRVYLSGPTLAAIYSGTITLWNDPAILRDQQEAGNNDFVLPAQRIVVFHRDSKSGTSRIFTGYLYKASAGAWPPPSSLPSWRVGEDVGSTAQMAARVANTPYAIGYVELAYYGLNNAPPRGVSYAAIKNAGGQYVTPDKGSITAAAASLTAVPADLGLDLTNAAQGYPISGATWLLVYVNYSADDVDLRNSLANFLGWVLSDGQLYNDANDTGYIPLPPAILIPAQAAAAKLRG